MSVPSSCVRYATVPRLRGTAPHSRVGFIFLHPSTSSQICPHASGMKSVHRSVGRGGSRGREAAGGIKHGFLPVIIHNKGDSEQNLDRCNGTCGGCQVSTRAAGRCFKLKGEFRKSNIITESDGPSESVTRTSGVEPQAQPNSDANTSQCLPRTTLCVG